MHWRGPEVLAKAKAAARHGIDETTSACVNHAKSNHPWQNQTGTLEGSLQMRPADDQGSRIVGFWGSFDVDYAIYLEIGTSRAPAYPYLRPAADAEYGKLAGRIKAAFS